MNKNEETTAKGNGSAPTGRVRGRFIATRHEVAHLVAFWMRVVVHGDFTQSDTGAARSDESAKAGERLDYLQPFVDEEEVRQAFGEAEVEVASRQDRSAFSRFLLEPVASLDPALKARGRAPLAAPTTGETRKLSEDAEGDVMPRQAGPFVIGFVDEIAGQGGEVVAAELIHEELLELVRHWEMRILDIDYSYFLCDDTGSTEIRLQPYASRRIDRIANCIGTEAVQSAVKEAVAQFSADIPPKLWQMFLKDEKPSRLPGGNIRWPQ